MRTSRPFLFLSATSCALRVLGLVEVMEDVLPGARSTLVSRLVMGRGLMHMRSLSACLSDAAVDSRTPAYDSTHAHSPQTDLNSSRSRQKPYAGDTPVAVASTALNLSFLLALAPERSHISRSRRPAGILPHQQGDSYQAQRGIKGTTNVPMCDHRLQIALR